MKTRIISGLAMLPLLLIVYFGGYPLTIAAACLGYMGVTEFFNGFDNTGIHPSKKIAYIMITILYAWQMLVGPEPIFLCAWVVVSAMASMIYGWDLKDHEPADSMATFTGIIYLGFFIYHLVLIDASMFPMLTWLVLLAAFISDIGAYFTGYFLGKHKLCPHLSPKKTIEGAVGGVVFATILCGLFGYIFVPEIFGHCVIMGAIGSAISQCGDLTASAFKRKMGIKDYGHLIPGHGGVLDRFDSVIFVAPFVFYYVTFIIQGGVFM